MCSCAAPKNKKIKPWDTSTVKFQTKSMERLMKNLPNGEAFTGSKVDNLPFAIAIAISPPNIGETKVSSMICVAHICEDQVKA